MYQKTTMLNPDASFRSYLDLAKSSNENGLIDEEISAYQKAIEINPDLPVWVYKKLGEALEKKGRLEEAIASYKKAIKITPDSVPLYLILGKSLIKNGDFDGAIANYKKVIEFKPDSTEAYRKLGNAFSEAGRLDEAVAFAENLLKQDNLEQISAEFYAQLGNAFLQKNQLDEAVTCYLKAIESKPDIFQPYAKLRYIQMAMQEKPSQLKETIESYKKAINKEPNITSTAYVNLGDLLTKQGKLDEAISCYQTASDKQISLLHPEFAEKPWDFERPKGPDFLIIGGMKCGTTSLYNYLVEHPQILPSVKKELHFFNKGFERGIDWYLSHFPKLPKGKNFLTVDASPGYIVDDVQERVFSLFPEIKAIAILRNPVDRCVSHYYHNLKLGKEERSFEMAMKPQIEKFKEMTDISPSREYEGEQINVYLWNSLYVYHLQKWLNVFPRKQLLILKSEDFFAEPHATMKRVLDFLELPSYSLSEYKKYNPGQYKNIGGNIQQELSEFFAAYNQQLKDFLGVEFNW